MPTVPSSPAPVAARLRHRRNARTLTAGQLADLRRAIAKAQAVKDDRGYQAWAGIHGLPLHPRLGRRHDGRGLHLRLRPGLVDHSGASYEARVFINAPDADAGTPRDDAHYAGSF